ncbi:flagellar motor protein MotB [Halomonas pacifica]|uniref:Flagellar motor protein MotB n=1 Tax=Bisbaumannia pacifica TaxID=77098 RepID=A0A510X9T3_9GAMM|nr:flagellar motor protein MotB [Halomonas pacifica]MBH8579843.1 flagellar motor protein MotB [Halomonas pacifica]MDC8803446.1 flagellar motor protein MotB [Halomonas pacifica]GEK48198.1 motility protein B [Halomonas pacifica]
MSEQRRPIIIRRKKVVHNHHGGAWKIALADFMTALMALFLVLWILSSSSRAELEAVAEYFRTPLTTAIAGGDRTTSSDSAIPGGGPDPAHAEGEIARIELRDQSREAVERQRLRDRGRAEERRRLRELQERIEAAIQADAQLRPLREQMRLDLTQEGLRIQLVDSERRPMFELGSDRVAPYMRDLLRTIAPLLNELPNRLSISGHTDSVPYIGGNRGYSNWELSSDRANASRRELVAGGLESERLLRVAGMADRVPMADTAPDDAVNRRISLVVLDEWAAQQILSQGMTADPEVLPQGAVEALPDGTVEADGEDAAAPTP